MSPGKKRRGRKKEGHTGAREPAKRSFFSRLLGAARRLLGDTNQTDVHPTTGDDEPKNEVVPEPPAASKKKDGVSRLVSDRGGDVGLRERWRPSEGSGQPDEDDAPIVKKKRRRRSLQRRAQGTPEPKTTREKQKVRPKSTQVSSTRKKSTSFPRPMGPVDLVIGVDFGTSCTKVMIRSPFVYGGRVVPVPLGSSGPCPILFPAVLYQGARGNLGTTKRSSMAEHNALKLMLMNHSEDVEVQARAAAYLSIVIRKTKAWFDEFEKHNYSGAKFRWGMNLGIPAETFDDEDICRVFREVLAAGWLLSERSQKLTIKTASAAVAESRNGGRTPGLDIGLVPEVAAAVKSYATSMERKNGLHLAVDVGAGTLDVCGFILRTEDEEDAYPILKASVTQHGAFVLHQTRMDAAELGESARQLRKLSCHEPDAHVPDDLSFYARKGSKARERVEVTNLGFARRWQMRSWRS